MAQVFVEGRDLVQRSWLLLMAPLLALALPSSRISEWSVRPCVSIQTQARACHFIHSTISLACTILPPLPHHHSFNCINLRMRHTHSHLVPPLLLQTGMSKWWKSWVYLYAHTCQACILPPFSFSNALVPNTFYYYYYYHYCYFPYCTLSTSVSVCFLSILMSK